MAKRELVPITREVLKAFYANHPLDPVPEAIEDTHGRRVAELCEQVKKKAGSTAADTAGMPTPTRIDDCFWRNRMICEELALSLSLLSKRAGMEHPGAQEACDRCQKEVTVAERTVLGVQERNVASVKKQMEQFMPQDFRGAVLASLRESKEARYTRQAQDLVRRGGTIRQKYDLFLQQQWERRQAIVQLGECSGVYKFMVKYLAGIPQVLLDFAKEVNAKLGPMEEQRLKYGPDLYCATTLGIKLNVCLATWLENADSPAAAQALASGAIQSVVEPAVHFYVHQMLRVVTFIGNVFQRSPFFISKDNLSSGRMSVDGALTTDRHSRLSSRSPTPSGGGATTAVASTQQAAQPRSGPGSVGSTTPFLRCSLEQGAAEAAAGGKPPRSSGMGMGLEGPLGIVRASSSYGDRDGDRMLALSSSPTGSGVMTVGYGGVALIRVSKESERRYPRSSYRPDSQASLGAASFMSAEEQQLWHMETEEVIVEEEEGGHLGSSSIGSSGSSSGAAAGGGALHTAAAGSRHANGTWSQVTQVQGAGDGVLLGGCFQLIGQPFAHLHAHLSRHQ